MLVSFLEPKSLELELSLGFIFFILFCISRISIVNTLFLKIRTKKRIVGDVKKNQ